MSILKTRHGAQGIYDGASKAMLENEFGTANEEECITQILEKGEIQESEVRGIMFQPCHLLMSRDKTGWISFLALVLSSVSLFNANLN